MIRHMSSDHNPVYLLYIIRDDTTQLCGDCHNNHEIRIPELSNQHSMKSKAGVSSWLTCDAKS